MHVTRQNAGRFTDKLKVYDLDPTFGIAGKVTRDFFGNRGEARAVVIQRGHKGQISFFCVSSSASRSLRVNLNRIRTLDPSGSAASLCRNL